MTDVFSPALSPLWTPAQAATYLGMKEDRLRRLAQRGEIGRVKDQRFVRFTQELCDDYIVSKTEPRQNPFQTTRPKRRRRSA